MNNDNRDPQSFRFFERCEIPPDQQPILLTAAYHKDGALCRAFALGLLAGLRRSEFLGLRYRDIDPVSRTINVSRPGSLHLRYVTLSETLAAWLALYSKGAPGDLVVGLAPNLYNGRLHSLMESAQLGPFGNEFLARSFRVRLQTTLPPEPGRRSTFLHTFGLDIVKVHFYHADQDLFAGLSPAALNIHAKRSKRAA